jgi:hypothetical protein
VKGLASRFLPVAAALWGFAAGVAGATLWIREPHPGQLPGAMLMHGLDGRAPVRMVLTVIAAMVIGAWLARPLAAFLRRDARTQGWVAPAIAASLATGLWLVLLDPFNVVAAVFLPLTAALALVLARRVPATFTARDTVLLPATVVVFTALSTWLPLPFALPAAAAAVLAVRLATSAEGFSAAPAAMLLLVRMWVPGGWIARAAAIAVVLGSPLLLHALPVRSASPAQGSRGRRRLLAWFAYPLFAVALAAATLPENVEGMPRLNLFEDGHSLMPAAAMLHGERPYRDIVPGHGLISDGLFDAAVMALGADDAGAVLRGRRVFAALLPAALYFVVLAGCGSAEAAILAVLLAASLIVTGTPWVRPVTAFEATLPLRAVPSVAALAAAAAALRLRAHRWLFAAGILAVLAGFTSVEFGLYAFVTVTAAALRFSASWRQRGRALLWFAGGTAAAGLVAAIALGAIGALPAFLRTMLIELPPLRDAGSLGFFHFPAGRPDLQAFPEIVAGLFAPQLRWSVAWGLVAVGTAAAMTRQPGSRCIEPIVACGIWTMLAALSYAERSNVYFMPVAVAVAVLGSRLLPRPWRAAAIVMLVLLAGPTAALTRLQWFQVTTSTGDPALVRYAPLPRAHGVWVERDNAQKLEAARAFLESSLGPGETFLDFANMPILYYFFDRRCPIRQKEVAFYEAEALQREVIARLEEDRSVRAALMQFPNQGATALDDVPNAVRTPLVFEYLRTHFTPAYERDGVIFWVRR